jgi:hypothetical protein
MHIPFLLILFSIVVVGFVGGAILTAVRTIARGGKLDATTLADGKLSKALRKLPRVRIADGTDGQVVCVQGRVCSDAFAHVAGEPCVAWRSGTRQVAVDFVVEDASGKAGVAMTGARLHLVESPLGGGLSEARVLPGQRVLVVGRLQRSDGAIALVAPERGQLILSDGLRV